MGSSGVICRLGAYVVQMLYCGRPGRLRSDGVSAGNNVTV